MRFPSAGRRTAVPTTLVCLFILVCSGCSSGTQGIEVFGKVSFDGKPIDDGVIAFLPDANSTAPQTSAIIKNGEYRTTREFGVMPGTYEVRIEAHRPVSNQTDTLGTGPGALDRPPETPGVTTKENFLPAKFNTQSTIEKLTVAASDSKVEKNYDLKP